ncbi:MAG: ATP-binding cassette domain-containing protein [Microthrixaceae bacterium]
MISEANDLAIECRGLIKDFSLLRSNFRRRGRKTAIRALAGLNFTVAAGETLGIVGPNGSGKSTLLKILAGVLSPTNGSVRVRGSTRSVLGLGTGVAPNLTGREVIRLYEVLYELPGICVDDIAEFSGLTSVIDLPLREYSDGMVARLEFATILSSRPDVLLLDEILAVGDHDFQERSLAQVVEYVAAGTTLLFVSHEMPLVSQTCERTILLRHGQIHADGPTTDVVAGYIANQVDLPDPPITREKLTASLVLKQGLPSNSILVRIDVRLTEPIDCPALAVELTLPTYNPTYAIARGRLDLPAIPAGDTSLEVQMTMVPSVVNHRKYTIRLINEQGGYIVGFTDLHVLDDSHEARDFRRFGYRIDLPFTSSVKYSSLADSTAGKSVPTAESALQERACGPPPIVNCVNVEKSYLADPRSGALPHIYRQFKLVPSLGAVTLAARRGETIGLIGPNGAGKSTLLRLVGGIAGYDAGELVATGVMSPVLGLSTADHRDLTGRETVKFLAQLHGLAAGAVKVAVGEIEKLADIGEMFDERQSTYSSGMSARVALATTVILPSDLIIIDESLSVGDQEFRSAVMNQLRQHTAGGGACIIASHDLSIIQQLATRVIHLDGGAIMADGEPAVVVDAYRGGSLSSDKTVNSDVVAFNKIELDRRIDLPSESDLPGKKGFISTYLTQTDP